jgi:hypothetical protein
MNLLFSQRQGIIPVKNIMQVDSMDEDLRNSLWNVLKDVILDSVVGLDEYGTFWFAKSQNENIVYLINVLWRNYFKKPLDTLDTIITKWHSVYDEIREYFFKCKWYEVYDFIEFIANNYNDIYQSSTNNKEFMEVCNSILERELSAYRFVGEKIVKITAEEEISEIEDALKRTSPLRPVNHHIKRALDLLADRKSPDYRNSIKESISAVESICNLIANNSKATLGQALKEIEKKIELHPALKKAFDSLYGYTSNAEGIRHALLDEPNLDFEDAKFMLVSCSGFINYLITKSSKAGVKL